MNLHVIPFTEHTPIDLSPFQADLEPSYLESYESFIVFTYKDTPMNIGLRAKVTPSKDQVLIDPIEKVYCKDIADFPYEVIPVQILVPNPQLSNSQDSNELDSFANKLLIDCSERSQYYVLEVEEAIRFLLKKQDPTVELATRLLSLIPGTSEHSSISNYLQVVRNLPSRYLTPLPFFDSIREAIYGLPISNQDAETLYLLIRYSLATRENSISPVLLDGPPGIGKTTFAYELATILALPVFTCNMNGVTDRHYINGFLRTYANSSPGIVVQHLVKAKYLNPIIVIDEIDKAPREVQDSFLSLLDPIQNKHWVDSYLGQPVDVSNVTWIFTSNDSQSLSRPFKDRLLQINLRYYSKEELVKLITDKLAPQIARELSVNSYSLSTNVIAELLNKKSLRDIQQQLRVLFTRAWLNNRTEHLEIDYDFSRRSSKASIGFQ